MEDNGGLGPEKLIVDDSLFSPGDFLWFGANKSKGLGVFSFGKYRLRVLEIYNPAFRTVVPIKVTGGEIEFNLFAVCANNPDDKDGQYVQQVWKAVNFYSELLTNEPAVLAGDFNSNSIWDKKRRTDNHSDVVRILQDKGIASTYHSHFRQKHGEELTYTFYLYRHLNRPYHI
ncbi:MAG: endonuclease/exonuclease/phosphatase family protein, partial [Cytophagaceae bacterium]